MEGVVGMGNKEAVRGHNAFLWRKTIYTRDEAVMNEKHSWRTLDAPQTFILAIFKAQPDPCSFCDLAICTSFEFR